MNRQTPLIFLRIVGFLEGLSYLILLLIAMPLKYMADLPLAVRVVGMAHGVLFVLYVIAVAWAARSRRWSFYTIMEALVASVLPAGTFFLEPRWRHEQHAIPSEEPAA